MISKPTKENQLLKACKRCNLKKVQVKCFFFVLKFLWIKKNMINKPKGNH